MYPLLRLEKLTKADLIKIIRKMNDNAPRADATCEQPGIAFATAAFRELIDEGEIKLAKVDK